MSADVACFHEPDRTEDGVRDVPATDRGQGGATVPRPSRVPPLLALRYFFFSVRTHRKYTAPTRMAPRDPTTTLSGIGPMTCLLLFRKWASRLHKHRSEKTAGEPES